jgi:hypothetical protein
MTRLLRNPITLLVTAIALLWALGLAWLIAADDRARGDCEARGGRPVTTSHRGDWVCVTPDGRVLAGAR